MLVVEKFPGANTLEVTEGVEEALDELRPGLTGVQLDTHRLPAGQLHRDALDNLDASPRSSAALLAAARARRVLPAPGARSLVALRRDPAVAGRRGARARPDGRDVQRDGRSPGWPSRSASSIDDAVVDAENVARRLRAAREAGDDDAGGGDRRRLAARSAGRSATRRSIVAARDRAGRRHGRRARRVLRARWRWRTSLAVARRDGRGADASPGAR